MTPLAGATFAVCVGSIMASRVVRMDMLLALWITAALLCWSRAHLLGRSRNWYIAMYVCMALGSLTKGPIAVLVPGSENAVQFQPGYTSREGVTVELTLLDKATGEPIGDRISAAVNAEAAASRILSVETAPDHIRVTAGTAQLRFPHHPPPGGRGASSAAAESRPSGQVENKSAS